MIKNRQIITLFAPLLLAALASSCFLPVKGFREQQPPRQQRQPSPKHPPEAPPPSAPEPPAKYKNQGGVYHTVERGQTIYRISKAYGVSQEDIIEANGVQDVTKVRVGQVLFIPGGKRSKKVEVVLGETPSNPPTRQNPPTPPNPEPPAASGACSPTAISLIWPLSGTLTSTFGTRNGRQHDGIDISDPIGTAILAAADGTVIFADRLGGYGLIIILKHEGDVKTIYAHNRKNFVQKGDIVKQGDKIAELGNSGNATGPHLHFEVRCGQEAVDPIPFLPKK